MNSNIPILFYLYQNKLIIKITKQINNDLIKYCYFY